MLSYLPAFSTDLIDATTDLCWFFSLCCLLTPDSLHRSLQPPFSYGDSSTPSEATSAVAPPQIVDLEDDVDTRTEEEILEDMKNNERSEAWSHFIRKMVNGRVKGACNYCKKEILADPRSNGTSSLLSHVKICKRYPPNVEMLNKGRQKILVFKNKGELKAVGCSQHEITEGCVHMIVVDELPFRFVEGEGFKYFCKRACPYWVIPCRQTIAKHVLSMYKSEKKILKDALKGKRVSLTTDTWTSIQNINYMVLTAHFVDDDWILHKKVLNFCVIPNHKGESIARLLEECMIEWEIRKILTITVDNASANDAALKDLIKRIGEWETPNVLLQGGENLHMRCVAHILNLIVNDGLAVMNDCIQSIRNAVRYVRSSPQRLDIFKKCIENVKIESKGLVIMDVSTRWNSTFLMLQSAIKFRKAFDRLKEDDGHYVRYFQGELKNGPPEASDWVSAEDFAVFLKPFYDVTLHVCCSSSPTIHTTFGDLLKIYGLLQESSDVVLSGIIKPMQDKYDKYWGKMENVNPYMFVAIVLDPRHKLEKLVDYYEVLYGEFDVKVEQHEKKVKDLLYELYRSYDNGGVTDLGSADSGSQSLQPDVSFLSMCTSAYERKLAEKEQRRKARKAGIVQNDVDKYLADRCEGENDEKFDILDWWRVSGTAKYPTLATVAKDLLAIPVSTIASESSFSTSGRVIDPFRSSLSPRMVEALICTQNWLTSTHVALHETPTIEDMELCEQVERGMFWFSTRI